MNRLPILAALALLAGCAAPINPTLLSDAQLVVAGLQALAPLVPPADAALANVVLAAVQTGLTDLQKGSKTPADFAALAQDEIGQLAPVLQADAKGNAAVMTGISLVSALLPVIVAEVSGSTAPKAEGESPDQARARLAMWVKVR